MKLAGGCRKDGRMHLAARRLDGHQGLSGPHPFLLGLAAEMRGMRWLLPDAAFALKGAGAGMLAPIPTPSLLLPSQPLRGLPDSLAAGSPARRRRRQPPRFPSQLGLRTNLAEVGEKTRRGLVERGRVRRKRTCCSGEGKRGRSTEGSHPGGRAAARPGPEDCPEGVCPVAKQADPCPSPRKELHLLFIWRQGTS